MKKIFSIAVLALVTLTLTGCGSKNLEVTCTKGDEKGIYYFENNKITKQYIEVNKRYANQTYLDAGYKATQVTVDAYNSIQGVTAEVIKNDNSITLKVTYDIKKMSKNDLVEEELNKKPKEFIKETEAEGFTCTTK